MSSDQTVNGPPAGGHAGSAALAIGAHPDDVEFMMAGTLILLRRKGWDIHVMHLADGRCGASDQSVEQIVATRQAEVKDACRLIGAAYWPPIAPDLQLYHTTANVAKVVSVIRSVRPRIMLLHSAFDYMEDHVNAGRIGVTAAFARGMVNFPSDPPADPIAGDVTIYHALPYGLRDPMRGLVRPGLYVDVSSVLERKRKMLAAHVSQNQWLGDSQGISYLDAMVQSCRQVGAMSKTFEYAEGWQRRNHLGFSAEDADPLVEVLGPECVADADFEATVQ